MGGAVRDRDEEERIVKDDKLFQEMYVFSPLNLRALSNAALACRRDDCLRALGTFSESLGAGQVPAATFEPWALRPARVTESLGTSSKVEATDAADAGVHLRDFVRGALIK